MLSVTDAVGATVSTVSLTAVEVLLTAPLTVAIALKLWIVLARLVRESVKFPLDPDSVAVPTSFPLS